MKVFRVALGAFAAILVASLLFVWLLPTPQENQETTDMTVTPAWTLDTSIGEIVAARPQTARIFELVGIDYCCGGKTPLGEAAASKGVDAVQLLGSLSVVGAQPQEGASVDWQTAEIEELLEHIVATHHTWLRQELPRLVATTQTVLRVHGDTHSELPEVMSTLDEVRDALLPHLDDEEQRIFPAVRELVAGKPPADVSEQLDEMLSDHDALGDALHRLRALTNGFAPPADACTKYREMLSGLAELERDMHTHVHLENNVLLPRVKAMLAAHGSR